MLKLFVCGACIGVMVGLSESPTIGIVITSILGAFAGILSNLNLHTTKFQLNSSKATTSLTVLIASILIFGIAGLYARAFDTLNIEKIYQNKIKTRCNISDSIAARIDYLGVTNLNKNSSQIHFSKDTSVNQERLIQPINNYFILPDNDNEEINSEYKSYFHSKNHDNNTSKSSLSKTELDYIFSDKDFHTIKKRIYSYQLLDLWDSLNRIEEIRNSDSLIIELYKIYYGYK